jgi:hypothetical protein
MLTFTKIRGLFSQTPSPSSSRRQRPKTRPALESLEGRFLLCVGGRCNWHPSLVDLTTKPSSLTTPAEVAHRGDWNQHSPFHHSEAHRSHGMEDLIVHHHRAL